MDLCGDFVGVLFSISLVLALFATFIVLINHPRSTAIEASLMIFKESYLFKMQGKWMSNIDRTVS